MLPAGFIDTSSPEAQFASELRRWLTNYGQGAANAQTYVNVAYAREYLVAGKWPAEGAAGLTQADVNAIVDLLNEFLSEVGSDDQTLINKWRVDI